MSFVARYLLTTGQILGIWESNDMAMLAAQVPGEDDTYGYLQQYGLPPLPQERFWVQDGELVDATELVLSASVTPFAADGVAACTIAVTPFVACTLLVNRVPTVLTVGDETLIITSDIPQVFQVRLAPLAGYWATPVTVEAV